MGVSPADIGLNDLYFWFIASDVAYYNSPDDFLKYLGLYDFIKNLKFLPKNDEIFKFIQNKEKFSVLSTQRPPEELKELFSVIELNNYYGLLTSQQKLLEYEERKVLEEALGLSVIKSPFTLASVGGAKIKRYHSVSISFDHLVQKREFDPRLILEYRYRRKYRNYDRNTRTEFVETSDHLLIISIIFV